MTIQASVLPAVPGYVAGTWDIDSVHSEVSFVVRHMVVSKVRGRFDRFEGTIVTAGDPLESTVEATINAASINTNQERARRPHPLGRLPGRGQPPRDHVPFPRRTTRR